MVKSDKNAKKIRRRRYLGRIYGQQNSAANSASSNFSGGLSAEKFPAANSAFSGGWGVYMKSFARGSPWGSEVISNKL